MKQKDIHDASSNFIFVLLDTRDVSLLNCYKAVVLNQENLGVSGIYLSPGYIWQCLRHFGGQNWEEACYWHLVSRSQGWCSIS